MFRKRVLIAQVLVFAICAMVSHASGEAPIADRAAQLHTFLDTVRAEKVEKSRAEKARELTMLVKDTVTRTGTASVDQALVRGLSELLGDKSDAVRLWAAGALGLIGPKANGAVPALQKALAKIEAEENANRNVVLPELDSRDAIQTAIERITGHRPDSIERKIEKQ